MSEYAISCDSAPRLLGSWPTHSTEIGPDLRVFNIVELCEHILEYLPCADLNRARSVCRQFRTVINQSAIMRQRSSLRLAPNQVVWATPDDILLTGIYAEDHLAAMKAKGRKKDELLVYEMHPYLKVDHLIVEGYQFSHRPVRESEPEGWRFYGFHRFRVGNFCLLNFPDHFSLDDEYISYPPVKEIEVYMRHTHEDNLPVRNKDGIRFKDIRAAVKDYLIEYSHERNWQSCSNTTTFTQRTTKVPRPHGQRWIMENGSSNVYDCEQIFFDCVCLVIVAAFLFKVYTRLTIDTLDIFIWAGIFALLKNYASFPMTPTRTAIEVSKKCPEKLHPCGHFLYCEDGLPITTKEKLTLEGIGIITEANDPYSVKLDA